MYMYIPEKLTDKLIKMQVVDDKEKDLYVYGFQQGLLLLFNMMTVMIIGFIFNMIWQSIVFTVAYSLLRAYAGGYHTSTQLRCYLFSVIMITAVLWVIKQISWNGPICLIITAIASVIVFILAPVEDQNKPLCKVEQAIFKKRTNIILGILIGFVVLLWLIGLNQISICISVALGMLSIMLVLGKIKNDWSGGLCLKKLYH